MVGVGELEEHSAQRKVNGKGCSLYSYPVRSRKYGKRRSFDQPTLFDLTKMNSHSSSPDKKVVIELSSAHALVLFELLSRFNDDDKLEIQDQAEARVLWDICGDLENALVEPFRSDYTQLLQKARDAVRDKED